MTDERVEPPATGPGDATGAGDTAPDAPGGEAPGTPATTRPAGRSPVLAAFLSFLFPGAGQAWLGRLRRAAVLGLPVVFLAGVPVGLYLGGGLTALADLVVEPSALLLLIALDVALLAWRSIAIVDGYVSARRANRLQGAAPTRSGAGIAGKAVVLGLVVVTLATHGLAAWVGYNGYDLVTGVFAAGDGSGPAWGDEDPSYAAEPDPTDDPDATLDPLALETPTPMPTLNPSLAATPSPTATLEPVPYWAEDGRLNLLLLGGDAGPGRSSIRTDSMILLTVDLATTQAALVSFPRNLLDVPLPKPYSNAFANGRFPQYLNALWRYADEHPSKRFPGGDASRGFRAVSAAIGYLAGVDIDGLAYLDLNGFVKFVDVLGGLDITVPYGVYDAHYPREDGRGYKVLQISAGKHHFTGSEALAYARSRHQDSDYGRMERQQLVLVAIRRQTKVCSLLPKLPRLVKIAKSSMYTNIPLDDLGGLMAVATKIKASKIVQLSFTPGTGYPEHVTNDSVKRMRRAIRDVFEDGVGSQPAAPGRPGSSAAPDDGGLELPSLDC